jgi:hypothetical protein
MRGAVLFLAAERLPTAVFFRFEWNQQTAQKKRKSVDDGGFIFSLAT